MSRSNRATACLAATVLFAAVSAHADPFELVYVGTFATTEALNPAGAATPTYFTADAPFRVQALFDTSTPNLAPTFGGPFNGFRAYAPSSLTIEIGVTRYRIAPSNGVTVAIFDQASFTPGRYGIGLIADPAADGAGFVGDFRSATVDYTLANTGVRATVFSGYVGVGHSSGSARVARRQPARTRCSRGRCSTNPTRRGA